MPRASFTHAMILGGFAVLALLGQTGEVRAVEVSLSNMSQVYNGQPKVPIVTTVPAGLPVELTYRATTNPVVPQIGTVFHNPPATEALSYSSLNFHNYRYWGIGNYLTIAGTNRRLAALEVTLVTLAKASDYPALAAANPAGYYHPVTIKLMRWNASAVLFTLVERTQNIFIPWRPTTLPDGSPYPFNGYAFQAVFDFSTDTDTTLPSKVMVAVCFNTSDAGFSPIGAAGPYDKLNIALDPQPPVIGGDADFGILLDIRSQGGLAGGAAVWEYPVTEFGNLHPLMRIRAWSDVTTSAPVAAGNYQVSGMLPDSDFEGGVLGTLAVAKAPATLTLGGLSVPYDRTPRAVTASSTPTGLPLLTTYNGVTTPPTAPGTYPVTTMVADANYSGSISAVLTVKPNYLAWSDNLVNSGAITSAQASVTADPDGDGISNLGEYAFGFDPVTPQSNRSVASISQSTTQLSYRRNPEATDLSYAIEYSSDCKTWQSWTPGATDQTVIPESASVEMVKVNLPSSLTTGPRRFFKVIATKPSN